MNPSYYHVAGGYCFTMDDLLASDYKKNTFVSVEPFSLPNGGFCVLLITEEKAVDDFNSHETKRLFAQLAP
ncbi:hypothetical protein Moror_430 [Moniliophthora roreri MCA 2997]|uniref:Uncharacterized protein n=2 Tax=Moniliophthora roreri TaxID=221103 RepID=V2Z2B6_MONRO|nr:hypothetical protein Moror_430 [Moniliophthora roreri MCA 2997]